MAHAGGEAADLSERTARKWVGRFPAGEPAGEGLPQAAVEVLASAAQDRVLSTPQVRAIHLPQSGLRWAQRSLARLERAGLVAHATPPPARDGCGT